MPVSPLFMVRFSKFNLSLKLESKLYNTICAFKFCEFVKIAKFAKLNRTRNSVDLQFSSLTQIVRRGEEIFFFKRYFMTNLYNYEDTVLVFPLSGLPLRKGTLLSTAKQGDNVLGSVRPSVIALTAEPFDLSFGGGGMVRIFAN